MRIIIEDKQDLLWLLSEGASILPEWATIEEDVTPEEDVITEEDKDLIQESLKTLGYM